MKLFWETYDLNSLTDIPVIVFLRTSGSIIEVSVPVPDTCILILSGIRVASVGIGETI
jgi:hypothetical protein